jgi:hypothetical protein
MAVTEKPYQSKGFAGAIDVDGAARGGLPRARVRVRARAERRTIPAHGLAVASTLPQTHTTHTHTPQPKKRAVGRHVTTTTMHGIKIEMERRSMP